MIINDCLLWNQNSSCGKVLGRWQPAAQAIRWRSATRHHRPDHDHLHQHCLVLRPAASLHRCGVRWTRRAGRRPPALRGIGPESPPSIPALTADFCATGLAEPGAHEPLYAQGPMLGACAGHVVLRRRGLVFQIDSHTDFDAGWDERLIAQASSLAAGRPGFVISAYPHLSCCKTARWYPQTPTTQALVHVLKPGATFDADHPVLPFEGPSACQRCSRARAFTSPPVACLRRPPGSGPPYDPHFYFHGEERALAVRLYTHGWDIFHARPARLPPVQHARLGVPARALHWDAQTDQQRSQNWWTLEQRSRAHLAALLRGDDLGVFSLGRCSFADYAAFSGIDYAARTLAPWGPIRRWMAGEVQPALRGSPLAARPVGWVICHHRSHHWLQSAPATVFHSSILSPVFAEVCPAVALMWLCLLVVLAACARHGAAAPAAPVGPARGGGGGRRPDAPAFAAAVFRSSAVPMLLIDPQRAHCRCQPLKPPEFYGHPGRAAHAHHPVHQHPQPRTGGPGADAGCRAKAQPLYFSAPAGQWRGAHGQGAFQPAEVCASARWLLSVVTDITPGVLDDGQALSHFQQQLQARWEQTQHIEQSRITQLWGLGALAVQMALIGHRFSRRKSRHLQRELQAHTRNHLQATLNAVPDLLFETDADGRFLSVHTSRPGDLLLPPELFLASIDEVMPPDVIAIWPAMQHASTTAPRWAMNTTSTIRNARRYFELSVAAKAATRTAAANPSGFVLVAREISQRKRDEAQRFRAGGQRVHACPRRHFITDAQGTS